MPLYDYDCAACGRRFEVVLGVHADGPTACPACGGGPVKKAFTAPAVHFKGSGWAKKERRSTTTSSRPGDTGGAATTPAGGEATTPADAAPATAASGATGTAPATASTPAAGAGSGGSSTD